MKRTLIFSILLALNLTTGCAPVPSEGLNQKGDQDQTVIGVFGGQEVPETSPLFSVVVGLYDRKMKSICTGSLIAEDMVLTAAHCVFPESKGLEVVFANRFAGGGSPDRRKVIPALSFQRHPLYDPNRTSGVDTYDVALVHFKGTIPPGHRTVNLNTDFRKWAQPQMEFMAIGYGYSNPYFNTGQGVLRTVSVPFYQMHSETEFRTKQSSKGVCSGDSGSPLLTIESGQLQQMGIASRVAPMTLFCRDYAVYTRVDVYLEWIAKAAAELRARAY